jgi:hypothetical protein
MDGTYILAQREVEKSSEVDDDDSDSSEEEEEEEEEEGVPLSKMKPPAKGKPKRLSTSKGTKRRAVGCKEPKPSRTIVLTGELSSSDEDPPPLKKVTKLKKKSKKKSKKKRAVADSPGKVKLGAAVVGRSAASQQDKMLSVAAKLRKKIVEYQAPTRLCPLYPFS